VAKNADDPELWVSSVKWRRVEWWIDTTGLSPAQVPAVRQAFDVAYPGLAGGYDPGRWTVRVFETKQCLIFVFAQPRSQSSGTSGVLGQDEVVGLSKVDLARDETCEAALQTINEWDP
jgi:hypothetical protein